MLLDIKKIHKRYVKNMALFFLLTNICIAQENYFQQKADYKISVTLHDTSHSLQGFEEIIYKNNSPHQLQFLYFHLWPNAYRDNNTALAKQLLKNKRTELFFSKKEERGSIGDLDFKINGASATWSLDPVHPDICKIILNSPLLPGDSIHVSTPFSVKIPDSKFSRLGHTGQAYFITQWYPKPAVYDKDGWHPMPYLDQGEFYSEFGSFDVSITVPENYVLAATGDRIDAADELKFLEEKILYTDSVLRNDKTGKQFESVQYISASRNKTIRFVQQNVHDFAWFCDKNFLVQRSSVKLAPDSSTVDTWVFFTPGNRFLWNNAISYVNDATAFYSKTVGPYPYKHVTAVDGTIMAGGGMEYPNITVIGEASFAFDLEMVIAHEIGHNWFYGMLGNDERRFPFLDEGLNSYYEMRYMREKYPHAKLTEFLGRDSSFKLFGTNKVPHWRYHEMLYNVTLRNNNDQPVDLPADSYSDFNYGAIVYSKTAIICDYMAEYMGEKKFESAIKKYFEQYKYRHPQPEDLYLALSEGTDKNLQPFIKYLISGNGKTDYKIKSLKKNSAGIYEISVKNKGTTVLPFNIATQFKENKQEIHWFEGFTGNRTFTFTASGAKTFKIDATNRLPEINRYNNHINTNGLLKKNRRLQINFITQLEDPQRLQVNVLPVVGYNYYNGAMAGISFHNYGLYQKKFQYMLSPLFNLSTYPGGFADLEYYFEPGKNWQQISAGVKGKSFAYNDFKLVSAVNSAKNRLLLHYYKIAPYLYLETRKKNPGTRGHSISVAGNFLFTDSVDYALLRNEKIPQVKKTRSLVYLLNYQLNDQRAIDPYSFSFNTQISGGSVKSSVELQYHFTVAKNRSFVFRIFSGAFLSGTENERSYYAFRASGYNGYHDYLFEDNFIARNERQSPGFNQFAEHDGAMKVWTALGQSATWLAAINIKSPKIFVLPLYIYADLVTCDPAYLNEEQILWNAGFNISVVKNIIDVYIPVLMSRSIKENLDLNNIGFKNRIRFTLNIHKLEPKKILKDNLN